jgi:hypothetical protein
MLLQLLTFKNHRCCVLATLLILIGGQQAFAAEQVGGHTWHTDYYEAYRQAQREHKLLLIFFQDAHESSAAAAYLELVLAQPELHDALDEYVRVMLPVDVEVPASDDHPAARLLDHEAFEHMEHQHGIAVMDLIDDETGQFGKLISAHPFPPGRYYTMHATQIVLGLPRATITQRALIYAIRIHPECPQSTDCDVDPRLLSETHKHSRVMARIEQVGHHDWDRRFHELNAHFDNLIVGEVAAVSWGGETLIEGAKDCVAAWRQSPGHWAGVSGAHLFYGYDLVLGASGKWYATGLFASQR